MIQIYKLLLITFIIMLLYVLIKGIKSNNIKEIINLDLSSEVKLRFVKTEYFYEYEIQFYNPFVNRWWYLPEIKAGIHAKWSFKNKGSYGAYDSYILSCRHNETEYYKKSFNTLQDIQNHFDKCNKEYLSFKKLEENDNKLPNILY